MNTQFFFAMLDPFPGTMAKYLLKSVWLSLPSVNSGERPSKTTPYILLSQQCEEESEKR